MFCRLCSKHFSNENSFTNHKNSKKHKELEAVKILSHVASQQLLASQLKEEENKQDEKSSEKRINELIAVKSDRAEKKAQQMELYLKKQEKLALELEEEGMEESEIDEEDEANWEDVGSEDEDMDQSGKQFFFFFKYLNPQNQF